MTESKRTLETLEIIGGALCLDFVNTINSRQNPEHDYLPGYADMVNWGAKVGILSTLQAGRLQKQAGQNIDTSERAFKKAREFRELLYRLFASLARREEPKKADMALFSIFYGEAISHSQLIKTGTHFNHDWQVDQTYEAILWPIAYSAGQILLSKELAQIKECPGCGWLFLDTSKNQSRRWCSMNTCGARDKMRRYHGKLRARS